MELCTFKRGVKSSTFCFSRTNDRLATTMDALLKKIGSRSIVERTARGEAEGLRNESRARMNLLISHAAGSQSEHKHKLTRALLGEDGIEQGNK